MINRVSSSAEDTHDLQIPVRSFSGAKAVRVMGIGNSLVAEHRHDWPVLSLYIMGSYRKFHDGGEIDIKRPAVILHGAGRSHANRLDNAGLEQLDIEFDPAWLPAEQLSTPLDRVYSWLGGSVAAAGARLLSAWEDLNNSEAELSEATARLVRSALRSEPRRSPGWLAQVLDRLDARTPVTAEELGAEVGLNPVWLAQAYRSATGEGLRQTLRRRRVEHATALLRDTHLGVADIAADAGFCDQSHMNRSFRQLLGRTPCEIRSERALLK